MTYRVEASRLAGRVQIPSSKSHTLRAILFASLAQGQSHLQHCVASPDAAAMIQACRALGARITEREDGLLIEGVAGRPQTPENVIDAGNSGIVLRFIGAVAALTESYTVITGDASIRHQRPVQPLLEGLKGLGAFAVSAQGQGRAPIIVRGPLQGGSTRLSGEDSQPVSGLLIASAFAPGRTEIFVDHPGEKPWIDLTLDWLQRLGIACHHENYTHYVLEGGAQYAGFEYAVPGDFSSAAFPLVAALITGSEITLENLDLEDIQGDKALIPALQKLGAHLVIDPAHHRIEVKHTSRLQGGQIDINDFIDALPILAVLGCFTATPLTLANAAIARQKECDRLACITQELRKMGAQIVETPDSLTIHPGKLRAAVLHSHHDHRLAMALAVAGLRAEGVSTIEDTACVAKTYVEFVKAMQALGAKIELHPDRL